jgi:hypothetical protein
MTDLLEAVRAAELPDFLELAAKHDVFFYYCGYFSQKIVEASADAIRSRLLADQANYAVQRKLISTFIEMGQNIVHYSADVLTDPEGEVDEVRFGTLCIRQIEGGFHLSCSNPVTTQAAARLEPKLERLSQMSLAEIKASYRAALKADDGEDDSKGGGLGLLTLARDSRAPLEFAFTPSDARPDLVIFSLTAIL